MYEIVGPASNIALEVRSIVDYIPPIALTVLLIVIIMYVLAYVTRYFHYLKMKEYVYIDGKTLDFMKGVVQAFIIGATLLLILFIAQFYSTDIKYWYVIILNHLPTIFFVVIVLIVTAVIAMIVHRFAEYLRGNLKRKPKKIAPPDTLEYAEVILKYSIYIVGGVIALIGGVALLPSEENALSTFFSNIEIDARDILSPVSSLVLLLIITIILSRFLDSMFEDMKKRSKRYSVRVNDILKEFSKDTLYLIATMIGVFIVLSYFLTYMEVLLTVGLFTLIFVVIAFLASDIIKNSFVGLSLMISDPFTEGDRVIIMKGLVCDIMQMSMTSTKVKTLKGEVVSVPNAELSKNEIINLTRSEIFAFSTTVRVDAKIPHQKVEEILLKAADKTMGVLERPKPVVDAEEIRGGAIAYELLSYTNSPKEMKDIRTQLIYNVQELFQDERVRFTVDSE